MCYNFDEITKSEDFDLDYILINKLHENIFIYDISYKTFDPKSLRIRFDKISRFIRIYDGTKMGC